jgi:hypothetical protein
MASYLTGQFDNARTGWNPNETVLTVASVMAGFGRLFHHDLDGTVYARNPCMCRTSAFQVRVGAMLWSWRPKPIPST